jgi:hypothetical protein
MTRTHTHTQEQIQSLVSLVKSLESKLAAPTPASCLRESNAHTCTTGTQLDSDTNESFMLVSEHWNLMHGDDHIKGPHHSRNTAKPERKSEMMSNTENRAQEPGPALKKPGSPDTATERRAATRRTDISTLPHVFSDHDPEGSQRRIALSSTHPLPTTRGAYARDATVSPSLSPEASPTPPRGGLAHGRANIARASPTKNSFVSTRGQNQASQQQQQQQQPVLAEARTPATAHTNGATKDSGGNLVSCTPWTHYSWGSSLSPSPALSPSPSSNARCQPAAHSHDVEQSESSPRNHSLTPQRSVVKSPPPQSSANRREPPRQYDNDYSGVRAHDEPNCLSGSQPAHSHPDRDHATSSGSSHGTHEHHAACKASSSAHIDVQRHERAGDVATILNFERDDHHQGRRRDLDTDRAGFGAEENHRENLAGVCGDSGLRTCVSVRSDYDHTRYVDSDEGEVDGHVTTNAPRPRDGDMHAGSEDRTLSSQQAHLHRHRDNNDDDGDDVKGMANSASQGLSLNLNPSEVTWSGEGPSIRVVYREMDSVLLGDDDLNRDEDLLDAIDRKYLTRDVLASIMRGT